MYRGEGILRVRALFCGDLSMSNLADMGSAGKKRVGRDQKVVHLNQ